MKTAPLRFAAAFLLGIAIALPARAGDVATLEILGFSQDGSLFAFEEYGIQDGSGFPYANRYYIDTAADSFVSGTPVRVRIEDEQAALSDARAEARRRSQRVIADETLADNKGFMAAFSPVTELNADPFRLVANPRPIFPPVDRPVEFRLEEIPFAPTGHCEAMGESAGFRLLRVDASDGGTTGLVHEDESVPASRGCPNGYRLVGLQTFHPRTGNPVFAVLIAIRRFGFEGPDFRYIAVTGRL
ncbi:MAG: DUF2259 domain-containing protein [Rhizobiaceae bacterium]|nr:DUF2259 domain-containing protein [Rhizobiaceae bacterium]MCV0408862.1 DUF2259 domain-containing protein [Rhizobiaceae bacterium]